MVDFKFLDEFFFEIVKKGAININLLFFIDLDNLLSGKHFLQTRAQFFIRDIGHNTQLGKGQPLVSF